MSVNWQGDGSHLRRNYNYDQSQNQTASPVLKVLVEHAIDLELSEEVSMKNRSFKDGLWWTNSSQRMSLILHRKFIKKSCGH